jgi:dipeptidyl aminopeptidase/acylaminoacyl peptidase
MAVLAVLGLPPVQDPPRKKLLDRDTYFEMESVASPALSPDGRLVVFTRNSVDPTKDQTRGNLWLADADGSRVRALTQGTWKDSAPAWSPDGKRIAFLSDRSGTEQIHGMWADTREVTPLTRLEHAPSNVRWSPDGKQLAFTMFVPDKDPVLDAKLPDAPKGAERAKAPVIVNRLSWAADGRGPLPVGYTHVFVVDSTLGGTPRQVTTGKFDHGAPDWSADGRTIYVSAIRKPDAEYLRGDSEIYAIDLETLAVRTLTDRKGPDRDPLVSPDGRWIAYTGYDDRRLTFHLSSLYVMDRDGGSKRAWAENLPNSPVSLTWAPDSSGVYFTVVARGQANVHFAPLEGPRRPVTQGVHVLSGFSLSATGTAAAVRSSFREPPHLVTLDVRGSAPPRKLVDVNEDVLSGAALGDAEELTFKSKDGLDVQGWLIKPADFDAGKKYPMVLWIHGGPWSIYTVAFSWEWQNFAANGYGVLYTNPRGSTGYGQDFVNGIQYSYPGKDFDDLMAGVDAALAKGWIDEKNLYVCGISGGGVLTAWTVGHTDRFAAAASLRPVINWHSFVGTTDGPLWYDQFRKYPWEDPMEYAVRSPLHYVANVKTPTLVMTGEADLRTPISQSEEFYRALKVLKKETLLIRVPEEFHGFRRPSHSLLQQLYLLSWFEKYRRK